MHIAIYSDAHGNLPALEAILDDIGRRRPDATYCLGDLVGYGPFPNEVIARIRSHGTPTIMGNYDDGVGYDRDECGCAYRQQFVAIGVPVAPGDVFREGFAEIEKEIVEVAVGIAPAHIPKVDHSSDQTILPENVLAAEVGVNDDSGCVLAHVHQGIELAHQRLDLSLSEGRDGCSDRALETRPRLLQAVASRKPFGESSAGAKRVELAEKDRESLSRGIAAV